jgi:hypothetical protein
MKIVNLLVRNYKQDDEYYCKLYSLSGLIYSFRSPVRLRLISFDNGLITLAGQSDDGNIYREAKVFLDEDGAGWRHYRTEWIELQKVADCNNISEDDIRIRSGDNEKYVRNLSEFNTKKLERLKAKLWEVLPEVMVHDIGKYLSPYTYNKYCVLHTDSGAHLIMTEKNAIFKIRRN